MLESQAEREEGHAVIFVSNLGDPDGVPAVLLPGNASSGSTVVRLLRHVLLAVVAMLRRVARPHKRDGADVPAIAAVTLNRPRAVNWHFEHLARLVQLARHRDERARRLTRELNDWRRLESVLFFRQEIDMSFNGRPQLFSCLVVDAA